MISVTLSAVPTGTVDLSTITLYPLIDFPILSATASTYCKSAAPSSLCGVPTAIKHTSEFSTPYFKSEEKVSLFSLTLTLIKSSRPGS